jgi:hypothetical protein
MKTFKPKKTNQHHLVFFKVFFPLLQINSVSFMYWSVFLFVSKQRKPRVTKYKETLCPLSYLLMMSAPLSHKRTVI